MRIESAVAVIARDNIDTDQIIPARFLKVTDKEGIGAHLFADRPELRPERGRSVLVAGHNFGCGSSREHAVWALKDSGFLAIVSTGFADIFQQNSLKNGLLPVVVDSAVHAQLTTGVNVVVDLKEQTLAIENGPTVTFPIDSFAKMCLLEGIDEIGYVLKHDADVTSYEARSADTTGRLK